MDRQASIPTPGNKREQVDTGHAVWTIGHGTAENDLLIRLLKDQHIQILVDVRTVPYSKYTAQANREVLQAIIEREGLKYVYMGDVLGGRPSDPNLYRPDGKPAYFKMEEAEDYLRGIDRLVDLAREHNVCIMCSEEDPLSCHRAKLIAPMMVARGFAILHIRQDNTVENQQELELRRTGGQLMLFRE